MRQRPLVVAVAAPAAQAVPADALSESRRLDVLEAKVDRWIASKRGG